jgi:TRL-like protein family
VRLPFGLPQISFARSVRFDEIELLVPEERSFNLTQKLAFLLCLCLVAEPEKRTSQTHNKANTIMKKVIGCASASILVVLLTGCVNPSPYKGGSVVGILYTGVTDPAPILAVAMEPGTSTKLGRSSAASFLGLIAVGDAGVEVAMKNGGITKVHHVDRKVDSVLLGLWSQVTTTVAGE